MKSMITMLFLGPLECVLTHSSMYPMTIQRNIKKYEASGGIAIVCLPDL